MAADSVHFAPLGELVDLHTEQINPGAQPDVAFEHYSIPAYDAGARAVIELGSDIKSNKFVIPDGSILLSKLNPRINRVWTPRVSGVRPAVASTEFLVLTPKPGVDRRFLHFLFQSPIFRAELTSRVTGTSGSHQRVRPQDALNIPVTVPSLARQQSISSVLGRLDDKIELNRRMSEMLGCISRALFQEWVIDRLKAATSWDTSKWGSRPLDDIADFLNGAACQRFPVAHGEPSLPVIKIRELNQGITPQSDRVSATIPQKWHIQDGDVLFSWSGTLLARIWTGGEAALNQHLFKVTSEEFPKWFYFHWVLHHLDAFRDIAADKATTMGHIRRHHLSEAICFVPDADSLENMSRVMEPLLERQILCELESRTLAELRDALLPKLISGELRVPEAEQLVSEVA